ncbi:MAG: HDIG domain-containing protein [Paludibacteraceae bacterium]|nr:HDIG domain-containing protein [Paludibacteraceae bacterium]
MVNEQMVNDKMVNGKMVNEQMVNDKMVNGKMVNDKMVNDKMVNDKMYHTILRLGVFAILAAVIVLLFPRYNNAFRYHYEIGKPWGYATLTADFDFPVYKTDEQMEKEQKQLLSTFAPTYNYIRGMQRQVLIVSLADHDWLIQNGFGRIAVMQGRVSKTFPLSEVYTPKSAYEQFGANFQEANLLRDTILTDRMREKLLSSLSPTQGLVQKGEKIIEKGEIVTERDYQTLQSLRRSYDDEKAGHRQRTLSILGEAILVVLFLCLFVVYLYVFRIQYLRSTNTVLFFCLQMLIVIALACLAIRFNLSVYIIPFAWVPVLTRVFFDSRTALFLHFTTILITSVIVPAPVEFFFIQIVVGMVAVSSLSDMTRRAQLVQTAAWILFAQTVAYTAITFAQTGDITSIDLWMYLYFFICALLTVGCYGLIYMFEKMFRFISSITLVELTDINSELLHMLAEQAPGTFQHSMQVSNLAAEAAKTIGANALLVRTGALYHDIGKTVNPFYFVENQTGAENPLLEMEPREAAQLIISHVTEGERIARKNHLPEVIINFITTHHGTSLVRYFYNTWCNAHPDEQVDTAAFQYPGPKPTTKEAAILMMADAVEARSRSLSDFSEESVTEAVNTMIDAQIADGQFAETPLSFKDVEDIRRVFVARISAMNHHRISYPTLNK